ncbi:MAG: amidohydrolase family protein [Saprospiraceae bacterium]|nr:amidohydrolase family protein [Saprospiraceae bacterium]
MLKKITADVIYTNDGPPAKDIAIIIDNNGSILDITPLNHHDPITVQHFDGAIVPGFVNAHCHLELSHLKGKAPTGTGLIPFLKTVVNFRDVPLDEILDAQKRADDEMFLEGIAAVGDISNKEDTVITKHKSRIRYYTFVEMFDFMQNHLAENTFSQYEKVFQCHESNRKNKKSCVPHSPYTVSDKLYELIENYNNAHAKEQLTVSIHNQETPHEIQLFRDGSGGFVDFFKSFGVTLPNLMPYGKSSLLHSIQRMNPNNRTIFVHNTLTTSDDIAEAKKWSNNTYWATCPNANLYIENRLPNYQFFLDSDAKMCIGTDSLTSNWQLSIMEEIKTILKYQSYLDFETVLKWATINGAEALGMDNVLGSISIGKSPSLVNIEHIDNLSKATSKRIV